MIFKLLTFVSFKTITIIFNHTNLGCFSISLSSWQYILKFICNLFDFNKTNIVLISTLNYMLDKIKPVFNQATKRLILNDQNSKLWIKSPLKIVLHWWRNKHSTVWCNVVDSARFGFVSIRIWSNDANEFGLAILVAESININKPSEYIN